MFYFTCTHCGEKKRPNSRLKPGIQHYCGAKACQNARRRKWKKDAYHSNPDYRYACFMSNKKWRKAYPAHVYQSEYRATHPEYTQKNRLQQRERNRPDYVEYRRHEGEKIVNGNALLSRSASTGVYVYVPLIREKIVNGNALLVKVRIQRRTSTLAQCRHP